MIDDAAIEQAVKEYADWFIQQERKRLAENPAEVADKNYTAEETAQFEAGWHTAGRQLATAILEKSDYFCARVCNGMLHPDNKASRRLFEQVTGLKLPRTVKGTADVVGEYAWVQLADYRRRRDTAAALEAAKKQDAANAQYMEYIELISDKVAAGEQIAGNELLNLATFLGVNIPPRTVGAIRKHVVTIGPTVGTFRTCKPPQNIYEIYRRCREKLLSEI